MVQCRGVRVVKHVLLIPMGSSGDVHPFLGMGIALRERGHRVTVVTGGYFAPLVHRIGLEYAALGTTEEYLEVCADPELWHARRGLAVIARMIKPYAERLYQVIEGYADDSSLIVVAPTLAFGARVAQEKLGVPTATVCLQPFCFRSVYQSPAWPIFSIPDWWPAVGKRLLYRLGDFEVDRIFAPDINAFRVSMGLEPVHRVFHEWCFSTDRVIGLFPGWYAAPQPDWPSVTVVTGFPLYDEADQVPVSEALNAFIADGEPPLVFTPGSANQHARPFFTAAVEACDRLSRRGVLLTRFPDQVPERLPDSIRHFVYAPLSRILPRAAALIHHGGIGTIAQALAAGVPQLLMPMAYDQPDNAVRLRCLGVGSSLKPRRFRGPQVARELKELVESREVLARCQAVARRLDRRRAMTQTCELIEQLGGDGSESRVAGSVR